MAEKLKLEIFTESEELLEWVNANNIIIISISTHRWPGDGHYLWYKDKQKKRTKR